MHLDTTPTPDTKSTWAGLVLSDAEIMTLRLRGSRGTESIEVTYEYGSVWVRSQSDSSKVQSTRPLDFGEVQALLSTLREVSRQTPRPLLVDSAALHAFIGALAQLVNSPGPLPFSMACLGSIWRLPSGEICGQLALGRDTIATIHDHAGEFSYSRHAGSQEEGTCRRLPISQLRALINALQLRLAVADASVDSLWRELLRDAVNANQQLVQQGL